MVSSEGDFHSDDLIFSVILVILTCFLGNFLRSSIKSRGIQEERKKTFDEFITAAEIAVFSFELHFIWLENYALMNSMIPVLIFGIYCAKNYESESNPVNTLRLFLHQELNYKLAALHVLAQCAGALAVYPLIIKPAWGSCNCLFRNGSREDSLHLKKIMQINWMTSVIEDDPVVSGVAEGAVTFFLYLLAVFFSYLHIPPEIKTVFTMLQYANIFLMGVPFSGGYYNPAIATALELSLTTGVTTITKIGVYWIGPFLGIVLALVLEPYIFNDQ